MLAASSTIKNRVAAVLTPYKNVDVVHGRSVTADSDTSSGHWLATPPNETYIHTASTSMVMSPTTTPPTAHLGDSNNNDSNISVTERSQQSPNGSVTRSPSASASSEDLSALNATELAIASLSDHCRTLQRDLHKTEKQLSHAVDIAQRSSLALKQQNEEIAALRIANADLERRLALQEADFECQRSESSNHVERRTSIATTAVACVACLTLKQQLVALEESIESQIEQAYDMGRSAIVVHHRELSLDPAAASAALVEDNNYSTDAASLPTRVEQKEVEPVVVVEEEFATEELTATVAKHCCKLEAETTAEPTASSPKEELLATREVSALVPVQQQQQQQYKQTGIFIYKGLCAPTMPSVAHYDATGIECDPAKFKPKAKNYTNGPGWDLFSEPDATELLNKGDVLFKFRCTTIANMTQQDKELLQPLINTSGFKDEQIDNSVPLVDFEDHANFGGWTFIIVKTCYMLPGHRVENMTPKLLGSSAYHLECEPGPPKVAPEDPKYPDTSQITITYVPRFFSINLMMKAHELSRTHCEKLTFIDGIEPTKTLLQERTTKDPKKGKNESTVTMKGYLMYYPVKGGTLCSSLTFVLNRSVPRVAAPLVNSFGGQGAKDGATTAEKTRAFLLKRFGDSRSE